MAAAIRQAHGLETELIEGAGGIFDIRVDDKLIYSKHQTGRFPEHDEILTQLAGRKT